MLSFSNIYESNSLLQKGKRGGKDFESITPTSLNKSLSTVGEKDDEDLYHIF
jgi:hypothetical protein